MWDILVVALPPGFPLNLGENVLKMNKDILKKFVVTDDNIRNIMNGKHIKIYLNM